MQDYMANVVVGYWTHVEAVIGVLILYPLYHHEDGSVHQTFIDIRVRGTYIGLDWLMMRYWMLIDVDI